MTKEPESPTRDAPTPASDAPEPTSSTARESEAILPFGIGERLDVMAQERFNRTDWIELAAAVLLAIATVMAAWSAYQATRWGGVQANAFSSAAATRTEATQENSRFAAQVQIDVMVWIEFLKQRQAGEEVGAAFFVDRFRDEFKPAFDTWLALVPEGEIPPGTPFDLPEYAPQSRERANELNMQADVLAAEAREANQTGDNFVLVAVIMASVLFFAGVGTKLRGRAVRLAMLLVGAFLFVVGVGFMLSMPQNVGL